jgi:hypothetical protein
VSALNREISGLVAIQLKAMAALQMQMAAALTGNGQDELRKHFLDSASLMMRAVKALGEQASA